MIPVKSPFPPGMIGVISSDLSRYPEFTQCLLKLMVPYGTVWNWIQGNGFALNRNIIVDKMIQNTDPKCEWLWFIDDDHEFEKDILMQLLSKHLDIVQPLVSTRKPPYYPYTYQKVDGGYSTKDWEEMPVSGLIECDAVGTGGVLIRREVFERVGYPWYEEGKTTDDAIGEDLYFCEKAKAKGFHSWITADHAMGHISKHTVWPIAKNGKWTLEFDLRHGVAIAMPHDFARDLAAEDCLVAEKKLRDDHAKVRSI